MIQWDLLVKYGEKSYNLMAEVENRSGLSMRIRIYGMKGTIVLRNNYPALHGAQQYNKPMIWALVGGKLDQNDPRAAKLLADIIQLLEPLVRSKFPMNSPLF